MVEEAKPVGGYSTSDGLAFALACLAGVMAIILFLVEKTQFTVVGLLVLMAGLFVYPVLHFVRRINFRIALLACMVIGTLAFGWYVWPKSKPPDEKADIKSTATGSTATQRPSPSPSPAPTQPTSAIRKPVRHPGSASPPKTTDETIKTSPGVKIADHAVIQQGNSGGLNVQQATTGDNSPIIDSPVTINPGPPPPVITICISDPQTLNASTGETKEVLTLTTSSEVAGPTYGFDFSGNILKSSDASSPDMAMNIREGVTTPTGYAFQLFQTWFPGQRINVEIHSIGPVSLKSPFSKLPNATFITKKGGCNSGL